MLQLLRRGRVAGERDAHTVARKPMGARMAVNETTTVELESGEVALVIREEDGSVVPRVVASADMPMDGADMPAQLEIVVALAKRLLKDPDFHEDVLDWFYEHQDGADEDEDEEEE